jgi:radical SAM protein with 4Fe4S-binding SPASM domain
MSTLLDKFLIKAKAHNVPLVTTIELTQGCNFKCNHCYNFDRQEKLMSDINENTLEVERVEKLVEELSEAGALYLNLSGGEVLLYPHLERVIKKGYENNLEVRLKTNGSLLSQSRCEKLKQAGLSGMDISLYGMSEESYLILTNSSKGFKQTLDGIQAAKENGFDVSISIILHRYNLHEISLMSDYCQKNELNFQFSTEITERYDQSKGAREFEITKEQFEEQLLGPYEEIFTHINNEKNVQCSCARSVCGISYNGEVYPCIGAPIPSGNIKDKTFKDIWQNSPVLNKIRNLKAEDFKECQTCNYIENCNRSSGSIYVNTQKYTGCDPVTFQQAKSRSELLNR